MEMSPKGNLFVHKAGDSQVRTKPQHYRDFPTLMPVEDQHQLAIATLSPYSKENG